MSTDTRFSPTELDDLEQRLWRLITAAPTLVDLSPPHLESLLPPHEACDLFADHLPDYAIDFFSGRTARWQRHPLPAHIAGCTHCQSEMAQWQAYAQIGQTPAQSRRDADLNITIFDAHIPADEEDMRRAVLDPRRPLLVGSDFLTDPAGWHYTVEIAHPPDAAKPGLLLSLTPPGEGTAAAVPVTLVLFGQVLQGRTNAAGQILFPAVVIPAAEEEHTPLIALRLHLPLATVA